MRHFVLDFPYSNVGPSQLMPGENAECACQALRDIFEWLGGVPPRIVFDNAAGVGRRMFERVRLTRLFQSFQAHYGFECVFCNAYAGHEKGGVESRVGAVRRKRLHGTTGDYLRQRYTFSTTTPHFPPLFYSFAPIFLTRSLPAPPEPASRAIRTTAPGGGK